MTSDGSATSCEIDIRVRYAEVDRMGVVHHSRYWVYFEMGRTELLRQAGIAYRDVEESGGLMVIAKCAAKFHAPARYDDVLTLTTTLTRISTARIDHAYTLRRKADGVLLVSAETTLASVDVNGRLQPIPDAIRRTVQQASTGRDESS